MKVSLIIVNYNGRRFLERLFDSIYKQTYKNVEVIFVDNCSSDDSMGYVQENHKSVMVVKSQNLGYGHGCNSGAAFATGDCLTFLNEDMYLPLDFVEKMVNMYNTLDKENTKLGGLGCKMVDFDADPEKVPNKYGGQIDFLGFPVDRYFKDDILVISGCPYFISKKVYEQVGGFNDNIFVYGEDVELSWKLRLYGYRNFMNNDTYLYHYGCGATGKSYTPKKLGYYVHGALISCISNYSLGTLFVVLPLWVLFLVFAMLGLLILKRNLDYTKELFAVAKKVWIKRKSILAQREKTQENRMITDIKMFRYISLVPALFLDFSFMHLKSGYEIKN